MQNDQYISRVFLLPALMGLALGGCGGSDHRVASLPGSDQDAADHPAAPKPITTELGIEMVLIPAGEFLMGDDRGEDNQRPAHRVRVSAFYIDTCEVSQESYQSLMGRNPAKFQGPDRPVERVSWYDATQYCNARSLREGLQPCYDTKTLECDFGADGYRLPTEAEWEYACRAGTATGWSFAGGAGKLERHAWFKGNSAKTAHPVRQKRPNPWGLYDMHGNVWEWCNDFSSQSYQGRAQSQDPRGPAAGQERVLRGGSWASSAESCRSASRNSETPRFADACFGTEAYGFRCVRRAAE